MSDRGIAFAELFDPEFLKSVARLRIIARRVPRGGRPAEQRSAALGAGLEFRDFRPYVAGDDLRGVDWNIYRRLGRVFLRLFEEVEDLPLYLLPDLSPSLFLEEPPRAHVGLRCALALASISYGQHDAVGLLPFSDELTIRQRPRSGKGKLMNLAHQLADLRQGGTTDFSRSIAKLNSLSMRRGIAAVVSDFFDPNGIDAVTEALGRARHKLLLIQLVRASDRDPTVSGDLRVVDCETGTSEEVSVTEPLLARYRDAYDRFQTSLNDFARHKQCGLIQIDVDQDVVPQLATLFPSGTYSV